MLSNDDKHAGKILVADNDATVAELLDVNLGSEGFVVECVATAADVLQCNLTDVDLVIVDSMADHAMTGLDLVRRLKDSPLTQSVGIILYSEYRSEHDVIDALDAGADDFMVKPISLRELVARVKAVLRRRPVHQARVEAALPMVIEVGPMTIDLDHRVVTVSHVPVDLTRTEFAILELLIGAKGRYVSRIDIHNGVWQNEPSNGNERKVDTNISRLRKKLGPGGTLIVSRTGLGYMLDINGNSAE